MHAHMLETIHGEEPTIGEAVYDPREVDIENDDDFKRWVIGHEVMGATGYVYPHVRVSSGGFIIEYRTGIGSLTRAATITWCRAGSCGFD